MKVVHMRERGEEAVRVDRGSNWGNPFVMRGDTEAERTRVCDLYELYAQFSKQPAWLG